MVGFPALLKAHSPRGTHWASECRERPRPGLLKTLPRRRRPRTRGWRRSSPQLQGKLMGTKEGDPMLDRAIVVLAVAGSEVAEVRG
jgi:hypothetical protein